MTKPPPRLGRVQLQIMQVLWRMEQATAREITEQLNQKEQVAHSTVQTLLRKMEMKGAITHELQDRTFIFRALFQQTNVKETALHDLLERVFGGSVYGLVSQLLRHEPIPPEEMTRLRGLIEKAQKDDNNDSQEREES